MVILRITWSFCADFDENFAHTRVIRRHYVYLVTSLMTEAGLLDQLYARQVLDQSERDQVSAEGESMKRNELLLALISRKSWGDYEGFLGALRSSGQGHIADRLTSFEVP